MILHPPRLETDRLLLRPFSIDDAETVRGLAGAKEVYATTTNVPHPYEEGMGEMWIASHPAQFYNGKGVTLAVTLDAGATVVGAIGLTATPEHRRAELGYWIGVPYWGRGYATEAAIVTIRYGFEILGYHKVMARHWEKNPASGRVMAKAGMTKEGEIVDEVLKDGAFHTMVYYGILNPSER